MAPTSDQLAGKLAPRLAAVLEASKPSILSRAGGLVGRWVVGRVWSALLAEIPTLCDEAIRYLRSEIGHLTMNEVFDWLGRQFTAEELSQCPTTSPSSWSSVTAAPSSSEVDGPG